MKLFDLNFSVLGFISKVNCMKLVKFFGNVILIRWLSLYLYMNIKYFELNLGPVFVITLLVLLFFSALPLKSILKIFFLAHVELRGLS